MTRYLSCAETAKLVRQALKKTFPAVKFSIRSKVYSGGASISVHWTDGPTTPQVDEVAGQFQGGGFDGSIDLAYSYAHYLMPDGSAVVADTRGTEGSKGDVPSFKAFKPDPAAERVHFGANYVFCQRELSPKTLAGVERAYDQLDESAKFKLLRDLPDHFLTDRASCIRHIAYQVAL